MSKICNLKTYEAYLSQKELLHTDAKYRHNTPMPQTMTKKTGKTSTKKNSPTTKATTISKPPSAIFHSAP